MRPGAWLGAKQVLRAGRIGRRFTAKGLKGIRARRNLGIGGRCTNLVTGGGGGSVGRIRINTAKAAQGCLCSGDLSPEPSFGSLANE